MKKRTLLQKLICSVLTLVLTFVFMPATTVNALGDTFSTVSAGQGYSFAIKNDGSLWAWGCSRSGHIGDGTSGYERYMNNIVSPVKIMDAVTAVSVGCSSTSSHCLVIKNDGSLWAWGDNTVGQLGDGTTQVKLSPVKIMEGVIAVSAGDLFSMAIKNDGSLWSWGWGPSNNASKMGKEDMWEATKTPVKIMDGVIAVNAGYGHCLAVKNDGSLWAWGNNDFGQIGDGSSENRSIPVKIMDGVATVSAGSGYSLAVKKDGSLWAWGNNPWGILGDGTTERKLTPVKIMDGVTKVAAGSTYSFAIKNDGSLWAWGYNYEGQLGDGSTENRSLPVEIMDGVVSVSAGYNHSLAIKNDGSLWGWGDNLFGGIGEYENGTDTTKPLKIMDGMKLSVLTDFVADKPSSWAEEQVNAAIAAKLVPQSLQSKYTQATTRAEFCALAVALYESAKGKEITERKTFDDTKNVNVEKAAAIGVVSGVGDNKFSPDTQLTREQAAVMLSRLADAIGKPLLKQAASFVDNDKIASWAIEGVGQVQAAGIMSGVGENTFAPQNPYTREQSIITIMRLYDVVK